MADQLIAATIKVLLEKAVSVTADRIGLVLGFYKDLEDLNCYAKDVQAVLADAETKQSQNPIVLRWLHKVEEVAREASYVLDELLYESIRRQVKARNKSKGGKVCLFFSLSKHDISFRWRMGSTVRHINDKLKMFNVEATERIGLARVVDALVPATSVATAVMCRKTDSFSLKFVAGRASEEFQIVEMLLSGSSDGFVSVLPIVGMGGIGKTTLAKSVYNEKIKGHFRKTSWFCVSEQFDVIETLRGILESFKGVKVEPCGRDALVQQIKKELNTERFLLVLDDVWNKDKLLWDDLYNCLVAISTANGSFCVVTTRLQTIANLVSTVEPFVLGKLLDDDCWSILTQRATRGRNMNIPEGLKVLKNQILRRCQGLPLAANVIGGLLSLHSREKWLSIVEKQILKVNEVAGEIRPILKLSFDNLPSLSIKKCFAYCSIYDKDARINGKKLVEFWMAVGFLQDDAAEKRTTMEEVGGNYLTILLQSSLLEKIETRWGQYYQMHDLVHDLAESISKPRLLELANNYHVQHLELVDKNYNHWNARSSLIGIVKGYTSAEFLSKFRYLHVLSLIGATKKSLDDAEIENLGRSIRKLKHLRCLTIGVMPESLCKLYNLQTLRLEGHSEKRLPHGLSNLISLRHIFFDSATEMAPHMRTLTCLRTLEYFNVGKGEGHGIEELGFMKNLEGRLKIRDLQLVKGNKAAMANLHGKKNLEELELVWNPSHQDSVINRGDDERVLEGLEPHPNLQNLSINGFPGDRFPSWWDKLSALVSLRLNDCYNCTSLPAFGRFPCLESVNISDLNNVACIGDSYHKVEDCRIYPSLKCLQVWSMLDLAEWKELQVGAVNDFEHCSQSGMLPTYHFPSLDRLEISNVKASVVKDIISKSAGSLKNLTLRCISGMSSASDVISNHLSLTSLEDFEVGYCEDLIDTDIPSSTLESCTSLMRLGVVYCPNLVSCPWNFRHTPSLQYLSFCECPNMFTTEAMPRGFTHLKNLRALTFGPFTDDSVQLFDWSGLLGLSTLKIMILAGFSDKHSNIPQQIQHFTSLEELTLQSFASVESLPDWFGSLKSLRSLSLFGLAELRYLPSASAMGSLTNLQLLQIHHCPFLKQSWDNKSKEPCSEWSKISGLPNLRVLMG